MKAGSKDCCVELALLKMLLNLNTELRRYCLNLLPVSHET